MFENEIWREIKDFPHYHVSNYGRVKRYDSEKARQVSVNDRGFPIIVLYGADSKTRYLRQVNKLVADAFLSPAMYIDETAVWHIDGDLANCKAENLRWDTRSRVLEWNEMNRTKTPKFDTPKVHNTRTGETYENAFDCAIHEGRLETEILVRCEKGSPRYQYIN